MGQSETGVGGLTAILVAIVAILTMLFILDALTDGGNLTMWPFTSGGFMALLPALF